MDTIQWLEKTIGGRWTGVTFHHDGIPAGNMPPSPTRFCAALWNGSPGPVVLTRDCIACTGAKRSFGWATYSDETMASEMAQRTGIRADIALCAIRETPRFDAPIQAVTVNADGSPDVLLSCMQPEAAMRFVAHYRRALGRTPHVPLASVMAVCGNLVVRSYLTGELSLSFGCPDSRAEAAIGRDRLIVGIPYELARRIREAG